MIPQPAIKQWQASFPWQKDYQIEQDLIICRSVCALFNDEYLSEHLAFRGGTSFNKLYLHPQPRYSEDIDLVQIKAEPIKETID
jgi:predicted nucleotidyltransferase component of viral defense system